MNCYVLTGGRSRRMGQAKPDLPFAGTTLLGRLSETARQVFERVIAVQRPDGGPMRGIETIYEEWHEHGAPLHGIQRALEHAAERCFILAVDYPLITVALLQYLRARFEASAAPVLVPEWSGRIQPLCGGYSPALLPRIREEIAATHFKVKGVLAEAEVIPEQELRARFPGEPLMNVNTPDELEEARRLYDQQQGLLASR